LYCDIDIFEVRSQEIEEDVGEWLVLLLTKEDGKEEEARYLYPMVSVKSKQPGTSEAKLG
jgi:hypothetical protein